MATTTTSSSDLATALWRRRSRSGPSLSARTKRPATSNVLGELDGDLAGGARVIVIFCAEGRWQQAKRAGGRQAAEAGHHRAQRARIGGNAHAHRQARGAHRGRELLDAVESASSARTRMKFTETEVRITVSEVSCALKASTNARQSTRHTPSVVAGPVRLRRPCAQQRL